LDKRTQNVLILISNYNVIKYLTKDSKPSKTQTQVFSRLAQLTKALNG